MNSCIDAGNKLLHKKEMEAPGLPLIPPAIKR
jgi:hypothetical protein